MHRQDKRFIFVVSTSGSVMNQVLESNFLRRVVHSVVADQACDAVEKARAWGVPVVLFDECSPEAFCARLKQYMEDHRIDYVLSFYTQFYSKAFRDAYRDRIINFHPSLLPAFKGMDGFGDGIAYHAKIIGTTVEFIKDVMDEGKIIMQTACAVDPNLELASLRHRIFIQQCKTLLQVVKWILEDRIRVSGDQVTIAEASYQEAEFSPALDCHEAMSLRIPKTCRQSVDSNSAIPAR
jgi:phosphoribosylglycinamide formyltransferase-1